MHRGAIAARATLDARVRRAYALRPLQILWVSPVQIEKIIERIGGARVIARILGVTRQAVIQWREVPVEHVLTLARKSPNPITPHEMRRDYYPHPLDGVRRATTPVKLRKANGKRRLAQARARA